MKEKILDLVGKLNAPELVIRRHQLSAVSPDDGKYAGDADELRSFLSPEAEWLGCANFQLLLLDTRREFGQAEQRHVDDVRTALDKIDPLNMALLEERVTRHDQLAVIEEIGRFVSPETKALLHPGTTSYDILDSVRSSLFREAWSREMRPRVKDVIAQLCGLAEETRGIVQVGRTHLQYTSPVLFGATIAGYAARIAERTQFLDRAYNGLRGKVSGIVGTGASVEMVVGEGKSLEFERVALAKLGLEPDSTATQIVQKERLTDVGHGLVTLAHVLGDFAGDMRILYSQDVQEVTSRDAANRLGGSSADASKNNPINWENIEGKVAVVESGMHILYRMIQTDFQRDLRSSVQARYQPQGMMVEVYEMFGRAGRELKQLSLNQDQIAEHLRRVRDFPSEAMVAILRGEGWVHPEYGEGHEFVKAISKRAKAERLPLIEAALQDSHFQAVYDSLPDEKQHILRGGLEFYLGHSRERAEDNIAFARSI